jgi:predicted phage terminase large subunit-like protein
MPIVDDEQIETLLADERIAAITVDTNIFDEKGLQLNSPTLQALASLKSKPFAFILSGTVAKEIRAHIEQAIDSALRAAKKEIGQGGHVRADWFPRQSSEGVRFDMLVQSWDTAHKTGEHNDWSVCTTWGRTTDDRYFLLDVHRAKLVFPDLVAQCRALFEHHRPDVVLVEDGANGTSLIQALRHEGQVPVSAVRPEGDKETRLVLLTGLIESQRVILPVEAPWIDEFLLEITRFPRARHDDQVDSFTQGLTWTWRRTIHAFW